MNGRKHQRQKILDLLLAAHGGWIPLPAVLALGVAQYNARIFELLALGFRIENRTERDANGKVLSWFRLTAGCAVQGQSKDSGAGNAPKVKSGDWYVRQTGQVRPKEPSPDLPLFGAQR